MCFGCKKIAELIAAHKGVIGIGKLVHSYPHSWRSKAPVIYRNTAQWFVLRSHGLRDTALSELAKTAFYPAAGQKRLTSMIEQGPIGASRQRAWGVPLTIFVNKKAGERATWVTLGLLMQSRLKALTAGLRLTSRFLGPNHNPNDFEKS